VEPKEDGSVKERKRFNQSFSVPAIEIAAALVLAVIGGGVWMHHGGEPLLRAAYARLTEAQQDNAAELQSTQEKLDEIQQELAATRELRDTKAQYLEFLHASLASEQREMEDAWEGNRPYTQRAADLRAEIEYLDDQRRAFKTDILEAQQRIKAKWGEIAQLETQIQERIGQTVAEPFLSAALKPETDVQAASRNVTANIGDR
jgi:septal ring factor EnvC (AmiA/AmiB activator)